MFGLENFWELKLKVLESPGRFLALAFWNTMRMNFEIFGYDHSAMDCTVTHRIYGVVTDVYLYI